MSTARAVAAIVVLPPPRNGMTTVSEHVVSALEADPRPNLVLAVTDRGGRAPWAWRRALQLSAAAARLVMMRAAPRTVYLVPDAGSGLPVTLMCVLAARLRGATAVLHHHVWAYLTAPSRVMRLVLAVGGRRQIHVFLCPEHAAAFVRQYGEVRHHVLPNRRVLGMSPAVPPRPAHRDGPVRFVHLSNLDVEKGTATVLEAAEGLIERGIPIRLELIGPCTDAELAVQIETAARRHAGSIRWHGPLYGDEKHIRLADADWFVFPTTYRNEAQPLVIEEALQAGLRVLATRRGCIASQVADSGIVVDEPADVERVMTAIALRQPLSPSLPRAIEGKSELDDVDALIDVLHGSGCG